MKSSGKNSGKILAIETSTLTGSVALVVAGGDPALPPSPPSVPSLHEIAHSGREPSSVRSQESCHVIGEITLSVSVQHSERLMPAVEQLLKDAGADLSGVDLFAVAVGPGSFTGLRIGVAAAQGFSLSTGKPVVGVSTLEGLALNGIFFNGRIVPLLDAFRGEVYRGLYQKVPGTFWAVQAIQDDAPVGVPALIDELRSYDGKCLLLGNGAEKYGEEIRQALPEKILIAPPPLMNPRASNIGFLGLQRFQRGLVENPPIPRYLRKAG